MYECYMDSEILAHKEENLRSTSHSEQGEVVEYYSKPCSSLFVSLHLPSKKPRKLIMPHSDNEEDDCDRSSDDQASEIRKEECDFFHKLRKLNSEVVYANKDAKGLEIDISFTTKNSFPSQGKLPVSGILEPDIDVPKDPNVAGENFYRAVTQLSSRCISSIDQGEVKKEISADSLSPGYSNVLEELENGCSNGLKEELENNSSGVKERETFTASKGADFNGPQMEEAKEEMANGNEVLKSIKKNEISKVNNDSNEGEVAKELNDSVEVEREKPLKIGDDDLVPSNAEKSNNIAMPRKRRRTRKDRIAKDGIALRQSKRIRMVNTKNGNASLSGNSLHCNSTCHDGKMAKTDVVSRKTRFIDLSVDEQKEDGGLCKRQRGNSLRESKRKALEGRIAQEDAVVNDEDSLDSIPRNGFNRHRACKNLSKNLPETEEPDNPSAATFDKLGTKVVDSVTASKSDEANVDEDFKEWSSRFKYSRRKSRIRAPYGKGKKTSCDSVVNSNLYGKQSGDAKEVDKGEVETHRAHYSISGSKSSTSASFKTDGFEGSGNKQDKSPATATPSHVDNERSSQLSSKSRGSVRLGRSKIKRDVSDKAKRILMEEGWKIDYRPRKGRNYDDLIYISPSGSPYWSLPKAWDVWKKSTQKEDEKGTSASSSANVGSAALDLTLLKRITEKRRELKITRRTSSYRKLKPNELGCVNVYEHKSENMTQKVSDQVKQSQRKTQQKNHKRHLLEAFRWGNGRKQRASELLQSNAAKSPLQGQKSKRRKARYGLFVRHSSKGEPNREEEKPVIKRTVLSWLLDGGVLSENERVQYLNRRGTSVLLEGRVVKEGIFCECCRSVISVIEFTSHAGNTNRSQPFENVYLSSGKSWAQCLIEAWDKEDNCRKSGKHVVDLDEDDQNDDTCGLCGDGGDLICCDKCPSTFHQGCLGLENVPDGDWYCLNCSCRICRTTGCLLEEANVNGLFCEQCETYYHSECLNAEPHVSEYSPSSSLSFCGQTCKEVFEGLQNLLGKKHDLEGGFSWTLVRHFNDNHLNSYSKYLTSAQMAECNAMVAVAYNVMDECFVPIIDPRTNIDMVTNVVFGSWCNLPRLNYKGFYTAVLEKDDEFISVASVRIHGTHLAEMPLIGTRHQYRRQGMCRRLVNAIEEMLQKLNVEKLILPAIPELLRTWTLAFGFQPLKDEHKNEIRSMNLMVFPGTDLLQKGICNVIPSRRDNSGNTHTIISEAGASDNHRPNGIDTEAKEEVVHAASSNSSLNCNNTLQGCITEGRHSDTVEEHQM